MASNNNGIVINDTVIQETETENQNADKKSLEETKEAILNNAKEKRVQAAFNFFLLIYLTGSIIRYGYLWLKRGENEKITVSFAVNEEKNILKMAEDAIRYSDEGYDVYFSLCTVDKKLRSNQRGTKKIVTGKTSVWCDIDIQGGKHEGDKYVPDFETARNLLPFEPTIVLNSGYGAHAFWIFDNVQTITDANREEAEKLNKDVISIIRHNAGQYGGAVDAVQDLARVLRVPGTYNYKMGQDKGKLVRLVEINNISYNVSELRTEVDKLLAEIAIATENTEPKSPVLLNDLEVMLSSLEELSDEEIIEKICRSKQGKRFSSLFDDGDTSAYNNDDSSADMALMSMLPFWTEGNPEQMERIFSCSALAQRDKWQKREDYREMTINNAIANWNGKSYKGHCTNENNDSIELERSDNDKILANISNFVTILRDDPQLSGLIAEDKFSGKIIKTKASPWGSQLDVGKAWSDKDDAQLRYYISRTYELRSPQLLNDAIIVTADQNSFHPVRDYINALPAWDGTPRAEMFFVHTLGIEDTEYTRSITIHWLKAAIKRVIIAGCKFDYCLVLAGSQGIGKSTVLAKLGVRWFNNSIDNINGKDALEQLLGSWIIELGEMQATKKADNEAIKNFISRSIDKVRLPYARRAEEFPRQCVFSATTNDSEPLKDKTGSRRFWMLKSTATSETTAQRLSILSDDYISQVWAEVYHLYNEEMSTTGNVNLLPPPEILDEAAKLQEEFTEGSEMISLIENYLDIPIPTDDIWINLTKLQRREFIKGYRVEYRGTVVSGEVQRNIVCSAEIAYELFEVEHLNKDKMTLREINTIMSNLKGWHKSNRSTRMGVYGSQKNVYTRNNLSENLA